MSIDFYPYPLMLGALTLTWALFRARKRGWLYLMALGLFGLYLLAAVEKVFFPINLPQEWPAFRTWDELVFTLTRVVNLIPFNYERMFADVAAGRLNSNILFWEIFGNFLLTVPFGLGINLFYPVRGWRVLWLALATGLVLESTELLIIVIFGAFRAIDINDVLLNGLGVLVGYGLFRVAGWSVRQVVVKTFRCD